MPQREISDLLTDVFNLLERYQVRVGTLQEEVTELRALCRGLRDVLNAQQAAIDDLRVVVAANVREVPRDIVELNTRIGEAWRQVLTSTATPTTREVIDVPVVAPQRIVTDNAPIAVVSPEVAAAFDMASLPNVRVMTTEEVTEASFVDLVESGNANVKESASESAVAATTQATAPETPTDPTPDAKAEMTLAEANALTPAETQGGWRVKRQSGAFLGWYMTREQAMGAIRRYREEAKAREESGIPAGLVRVRVDTTTPPPVTPPPPQRPATPQNSPRNATTPKPARQPRAGVSTNVQAF